ncbi:hypothetical protein DFH29DRAFT_883623 [Suillus ampliporus]|nr:hypothetical protein DFH29DRAFT_883623 [Suillus ampliporus]
MCSEESERIEHPPICCPDRRCDAGEGRYFGDGAQIVPRCAQRPSRGVVRYADATPLFEHKWLRQAGPDVREGQLRGMHSARDGMMLQSDMNNCKMARFLPQNIADDMEESRAALQRIPPPPRSLGLYNLVQSAYLYSLQKPAYLYNIAKSTCLYLMADFFFFGFASYGIFSDLERAIECYRAALNLLPPGHSYRYRSLRDLALSLQTRFVHRGIMSDLDESIELYRLVLELHPFRSLTSSLLKKIKQQDLRCGLDEGIELYRAALSHFPSSDLNQPISLDNLATSLMTRFDKFCVRSDIDESIELHRAALTLFPPGHSERSISLDNLASTLCVRFNHFCVQSDLDESIELHQAALTPSHPHPFYRYQCLQNLATSLFTRFNQRGGESDLDRAIELLRVALAHYPPGHPNRFTTLTTLASFLFIRRPQRRVLSDQDEIFRLYLQLSGLSHAITRHDLSAAKSWAAAAEKMEHESALLAYQIALKFLDQRVARLSSSLRHFDIVRKATSSLATDAFSCAVRRGALTTAVELVEQGRAVFWTQLARFRTPIDELSLSDDTGATLAGEFTRLRTTPRKYFSFPSNGTVSSHASALLPDFSQFLLRPLFSDLQKAAEKGPVIIMNASQYGCDALIVFNAQDPVRVPLPITWTEVSELSSDFQTLAKEFGRGDHQNELVNILRQLWYNVVEPVVRVLRQSNVKRDSRIWWCPTAKFTLLLLYAAGLYEKKGDRLSHIYISSYTPSLAALVHARQKVSPNAPAQHFVAIGQATPDQGTELILFLDVSTYRDNDIPLR